MKEKTILEGRLKEADHLGNLDDVRGEKIRAPDLNAKRGSIAGNEGFFIKGLDPTRTHGVRILHGSLQIFGTTRVLNLTNLSDECLKHSYYTRVHVMFFVDFTF